MKTKSFLITLGAAWALGLSATNTVAAEKDSTAQSNHEPGIQIASRAGAKVDKLATKLTERAKVVTKKAEHAVAHVAKRVEQVGHKAEAAAKKTVHKVGEKIEKISE